MSKEGCHTIFPNTEDEKQRVRMELGLKESTIQDDIDGLVEWFEKEPHLVCAGLPDRDFLERMLINSKGSREKTKHRLDNFYKYRSFAPELIQNRDVYIDTNADIWSFYRQAAIPQLYELKRITVLEFTDPEPNNYDIEILMRNTLLLGDIRLRYDYMLGDIWVLDLKNISVGHILRTNPVIFAKASNIFHDGLGIRVYGIHILGASSFTQQLMQFVSKFAKPKILERIVFHNSIEDLYKHIPKEYLPKEYGGYQPSMDCFKDKYINILKSDDTKQLLAECSKQISDEKLRPGAYIDEEYLNGTFKKLDLD